MLKHKTILAIMIICSLFLIGYINSSDAEIEIVEMDAYGTAYAYGGISLSVSVETNEPYDEVNYYLDGTWIGASSGDNEKTEASFYAYVDDAAEGSVHGRTYSIRADAWRQDDEGNFSQDSDYYFLKLYKPLIVEGYKNTGAYGTAVVSKHYFDGTSFVMDAYANACNGSDETLRVSAWFRQQRYNEGGNVIWRGRDDDQPNEDIEPDKWSNSISPDSMKVDFFLGRLIEADDSFRFDAHTHLRVSTVQGPATVDDWRQIPVFTILRILTIHNPL